MKDSLGRELNIGDEVAFTVGTAIKTGVIASIKPTVKWGHNYTNVKVALTIPETSGGRIVTRRNENGEVIRDANGYVVYDTIDGKPKLFRTCDNSTRIILLKPIANLEK